MRRTRHNHHSDEDFLSADNPEDQTSYHLDYDDNTRIVNPNAPSTSQSARASGTAIKKYFARKSTATGPHGRVLPSSISLRGRQSIHEPEPEPEVENQRPANVHKRKPSRPISKLQRDRMFLKQVRKLQDCTTFMIPKLPFARLVREIIYAESTEVTSISLEAMTALQESSEMYVTQVLNDAYLLTLHRKRVTLSVDDLQVLKVLRLMD